jgi:hypothetical protein
MDHSHHLLERDNSSIGNGDTPLQLLVTLSTMCDLGTQYVLDLLRIDLLFAHGLTLLFLFAPTPP